MSDAGDSNNSVDPILATAEDKDYRDKKNLLIEALSYIGKFKGATIVVKYGGAAMVRDDIKVSFTHDMVLLQSLGMRPLVVHGGGPEVSSAMHTMGQKAEFVEGLRITNKESLRITEMVLSGNINKEIVANINIQGGKGVGVSGKDGMTLQARKLPHVKGIDLGFVGEIVKVETELIELLLDNDFLPVISPIGIGTDGQTYNINADTAASRIAAALGAEKMIFMTDVPGIVDNGKLLSNLSTKATKGLIDTGVIQGGMLPKVEAMLYSLANGVRSAHIISGLDNHAVIAELFTDEGIGTVISI